MNTTPKITVTIVGIGRVGGALAAALPAAGIELAKLVFRVRPAAEVCGVAAVSIDAPGDIESDVVLVAVPDDAIESVAASLAPFLSARRPVVLHLSGAMSSGALAAAAAAGCAVGSMHPLVSVSDAAGGAAALRGAWYCLEGDAPAVTAAEEIAGALGGRTFTLTAAAKPLYHAAAVTACGHYVALFAIALEMLAACGIDQSTARAALMPLVESTVANLCAKSPEAALTGPFARGDARTLERHLSAFEGAVSDDDAAVYLRLAEKSLELAARNGLDASRAAGLAERISFAKRNLKC